jgi:uncharacterized protein (DUF58 family)
VGEVRASSPGSALELHDFRGYHPGDDLRQIDWNAAARLGELVVRVREEEVSPRVEVVLDATASMGVGPTKAARAVELAAWMLELARRAGCQAVLVTVGDAVARESGAAADALLRATAPVGRVAFELALGRAPVLRACGLRLVVSDFLFETSPSPLAERLARGASGLALVQVLDPDDLEPLGGGARLVDAETGEALERLVTDEALARYGARLAAHGEAWAQAARRVRGRWASSSAGVSLEALARGTLSFLVDAGAGA